MSQKVVHQPEPNLPTHGPPSQHTNPLQHIVPVPLSTNRAIETRSILIQFLVGKQFFVVLHTQNPPFLLSNSQNLFPWRRCSWFHRTLRNTPSLSYLFLGLILPIQVIAWNVPLTFLPKPHLKAYLFYGLWAFEHKLYTQKF